MVLDGGDKDNGHSVCKKDKSPQETLPQAGVLLQQIPHEFFEPVSKSGVHSSLQIPRLRRRTDTIDLGLTNSVAFARLRISPKSLRKRLLGNRFTTRASQTQQKFLDNGIEWSISSLTPPGKVEQTTGEIHKI